MSDEQTVDAYRELLKRIPEKAHQLDDPQLRSLGLYRQTTGMMLIHLRIANLSRKEVSAQAQAARVSLASRVKVMREVDDLLGGAIATRRVDEITVGRLMDLIPGLGGDDTTPF